MATLTVTATAQPTSSPPGVRLDITATGTPTVTSVTVTRTNQSGLAYPVRTFDGDPLPVSGGVATIFDYEIPYGETVTYSVAAAGATTVTKTASVAVSAPWLVHVGLPAKSITVDFRIGTNDEEVWDADDTAFQILNSSTPIPVFGGARQAPASSLIVGTDTPTQAEALRSLLADRSPLLLNVPTTLGLGLATCYISVGAVQVKRRSNIGTHAARDFTLPYRVVGRPAGGSQALRTWTTVAGERATWAAIPAGTTWAQLANPVT